MTAHVRFAALDSEFPATLSRSILTDLLRTELGFTGVCFTDCMQMDAIAQSIGSEKGAVLALAAGADCITVSHSLERARGIRAAIVDAVRDGSLPVARLQQAAQRIATLRESTAVSWNGINEKAGVEAARRAVTVARNERLGGVRVTERVTVISFEGATRDGAEDPREHQRPSLSLALRERHVRSELFRVALDPDAEMIDQLTQLVRSQPGRDFVIVARRAHAYTGQRRAIAALLDAAPDALVVVAREPIDATLFPQARAVLCTYGDGDVTVAALADVLTGRIAPQGRLPVHLALPASP